MMGMVAAREGIEAVFTLKINIISLINNKLLYKWSKKNIDGNYTCSTVAA